MKFTVAAERGTTGRWTLQCVEFPGAISEAKSLASAPELMREAIAFVAEVDPADVEIEVQPVLPASLRSEIDAARDAARRLAQQQREVAELSSSVVKHLVDCGLSGRDVATVLEVSPQRVSQLANRGG